MLVGGSIAYNDSNFHRRARMGLIPVRGPRDFSMFVPNDFRKELNVTIALTPEYGLLIYLLSL